MSDTRELAGKVAIVTGSARRMGRAIALRLAREGTSVVVSSKASPDAAREVCAEIEALGSAALPFVGDVTDPATVKRMVAEAVERFGRIDILVNNIAYRPHTPIAELTLEMWHTVLATVLDAAFLCSQACAPHLTASEGTIVNIGGVSAHFGNRNHGPVMTAKAGLVGYTRSLAMDLAPHVTANCVIPGRIQDKNDGKEWKERKWHYALDRIPLGRAGTLEEIAEAVAVLCRPGLRFINGQSIHVNGGMFFGS